MTQENTPGWPGEPSGSGDRPEYGAYQPYPNQPMGPAGSMPPNYLGWSITAAVCGFLFCLVGLAAGIPAIVYSTQVKSKWNIGDLAGAADSSGKARGWAIAATVLDVVGLVIFILVLTMRGQTT